MRQEFDNNSLVSIVVPVYNAEKYLAETIRYVKLQTYTNWELLLVNDCSTDRSKEIALAAVEEDARICLIEQERNAGAANARNRGVQEAKGRFICFLDADDIWYPEKIEKEIAFLNEKKASFVFMGYEFADHLGNGTGAVVHVPETISYKQALKNTTIFTSTVMLDRMYVNDEDMLMPQIASEDTATWWHLLKKYGVAYGLDLNLVRYRRSANTLSSNKIEAIKRIWNLYRKQESLSVLKSVYCLCFWAIRAVKRRV